MKKLPSPGLLVALLALAVALAGTAVAVNRAAKVKTKNVDLVQYEAKAGLIETTSSSFVDDGPDIEGKARKGDLLRISAQVTIQKMGGPNSCSVFLGFQGAGLGENGGDVITTSSMGAQTFWLAADPGGALAPFDAIERTVPVSGKGPYRVSLNYRSGDNSTVCDFSERHLWVEHVR